MNSDWRQVVFNIKNSTGHDLTFVSKKAKHGRFEVDPPEEIKSGETRSFKVNKNALGSTIGPEGYVRYKLTVLHNLEMELTFTWNHPQGSAKSAYTVYSNPPQCVSGSLTPASPTGHNQTIVLEAFLQNLDQVYDIRGWMKSIDSETSLADLNIPGTHDSGARYGGAAYETQRWSIPDQLKHGVRFLDIRLKPNTGVLDGGAYGVYHNDAYQKLTFKDVLDACSTYLGDNDQEAIVMLIDQEDKSDATQFGSALEMYITERISEFYTGDDIPKLGDVRKKIVLLRRYEGSLGFNCRGAWPHNSAGWFHEDKIYVQDYYKVAATKGLFDFLSRGQKWEKVSETFSLAQGKPGPYILNYTSGSAALNPVDVAVYMNPRVYNTFAHAQKVKFGVTVMDYVDDIDGQIIPLIVASNTFSASSD